MTADPAAVARVLRRIEVARAANHRVCVVRTSDWGSGVTWTLLKLGYGVSYVNAVVGWIVNTNRRPL